MMHQAAALVVFAALFAEVSAAGASLRDVPHPFMLWTRDDAAAIRRRIETEPWAKLRYEELLRESGRGGTFRNLFRYVVMGDVKAGQDEKNYLLGIIGTHPRNFERLEHGGRHYDCYLDALRYDAVYDLLTPEQRVKIEDTFRAYIDYQFEDKKNYTRTSWLPNMQWPRVMSAHLMAVAIKDEARLRKLIEGNGGWKYYLDSYLTGEGFYMEEFGKQYSMLGEMLLFCRGLERLGLDELGYGYVGAGGATMRKTLETIPLTGYPRTDLPGGMPHIARITMGDARGGGFPGAPPYVFQHAIVTGFLRNRGRGDDPKAPEWFGGNEAFTSANMNGRDHKNAKVDKLLAPHWFEIAHAKWPDAGFDYFLARMRRPGESAYTPSLYWGLSPIDQRRVTPPPAPSYVSNERGLAMLRSESGPAYWESPAPAVALQLALYYVHYTRDSFALLGFHAFNRPLYLNRGIADGYAGGDPWTDSARGHCGLVVDNLPGSPVGQVPTRFRFDSLVQFVAVTDDPRVSGGRIRDSDNREIVHDQTVVPGQVRTRALVLTRNYLFDVTRSSPSPGADASTPRTFDWQVHALGIPRLDEQWSATNELDGGALYRADGPGADPRLVAKALAEPERYDLRSVRKLGSDGTLEATVIQQCASGDPESSALGPEWHRRGIGVRVRLLGAPGTTAYVGETARYAPKPGAEPGKGEKSSLPNEVGGTTVLFRREAPAATFVALHEPFDGGRPTLRSFDRIAETEAAVVARVELGDGTSDRVMVRFDEKLDERITLDGDGESYTFIGFGHVHVGTDVVRLTGDIEAARVKVNGTPRLWVNGREVVAEVRDGVLVYSRAADPKQ